MQPKLIHLLIIFMLPLVSIAQPNPACSTVTFQKEIRINFEAGYGYYQSVHSYFETLDKQFLLSGKLRYWPLSNSNNISGDLSYVSKTDTSGNVIWFKSFKDSAFNSNFSLQLADSSFIIYASVHDGATASEVCKLIKLNKNGDFLWNKTIWYRYSPQYSSYLVTHSIIQTTDGNLLMLSSGEFGLNITKLDTNANILWTKDYELLNASGSFGYDHTVINRNFVAEKNDGYIITIPVGVVINNNTTTQSIQLLKINIADGNLQWSKQISETGVRYQPRITINNDNDILIHAYTNTSYSAELSNTLFKIDNNGNLINCIRFIAPHHHIGSARLNDGIICIARDSAINSINPYSILQFDNGLNLQWAKKYSFNNINETSGAARPAILQTKDSSVYAFLTRPSIDGTASRLYLLKADRTGNAGSCESENINIYSFRPPAMVINMPAVANIFSDLEVLQDTSVIFNNLIGSTNLICQRTSFCDSINLTGNTSICNTSDSINYFVTRNVSCFTSPIWQLSDTSFGNIIVYSDTSIKIKFNRTGQVKLYATIPTACGIIKDSLLINVHPSASDLNLGADFTICGDSSMLFDAGEGYQQYLWQDGSTSQQLAAQSPGLYYVTVTDFCNNSYKDSIIISAASPETIDIGNDVNICAGDTITLAGPADFTSYNWLPAYNLQNQNTQTADAYPATTTKYYLHATKSPGCISIDSITVNVNPLPAIQFPQDSSICTGQFVTLDAGPGFNSYNWNTGQTTQQITVNTTGIYIATVSDNNGCMATDSFALLNVYPNPVVNISDDNYLCRNTTTILSATGNNGFEYLWQDGSISPTYLVSDTGFYKLIIRNPATNCTGSDSIHISRFIETPANFLPKDTAVCSAEPIIISAQPGFANYTWSTGSTAESIAVTQPGMIYLTVTDGFGCTGKDTLLVSPKDCRKLIYFPSAFTPNSDGLNDVFRGIAAMAPQNYQLEVYNRYGTVIYSSTNILAGWDGRFKNKLQNTGGYIWIARYQFEGLPPQQQKGTVLLFR